MKGETNGVKWRSLRTDAQIQKEYDDKLKKDIGELPEKTTWCYNAQMKSLAQKRMIIYATSGKHRGNNKEVK